MYIQFRVFTETSGLTCTSKCIHLVSHISLNITFNVRIYIQAKAINRFLLEMNIYNHYMN